MYHWLVILKGKKMRSAFMVVVEKTVSLDYWSTLFMRWFAFSKVLYDDDRARAQKEIATHKKEEERI